MLNIDFLTLSLGRHGFEYKLDDAFFEALDQNEVLGGNVDAKVGIVVNEQSFQLHLELKGSVNVTCDRCLDPVSEPIETEDDILVKLAAEDGEDETCIYLQETHPVLDLGWLLYEEISVSLPIVSRHQPGECNPQMEELLQAHLCTTIEDDEE